MRFFSFFLGGWPRLSKQLAVERLPRRITDDQYDKFYQSFRDQIGDIDTKLALLQEAEDNYYITAKYLLELANRAYELFVSSEVEERRQLIKLILSNLRVEGKKVRYDALKPFDTILNCSERQLWLRTVDQVRNFFMTTTEYYLIPNFNMAR